MGNGASSGGGPSTSQVAARESQSIMKNFIDVDVETSSRVVEHYMPPTFPVHGKLTPADMKLCRSTWKSIIDGTASGMVEYTSKAGIVLFYDEFFFRLFKRAKIFLDIFPDVAKRGEVLMKAIGFLLRITGEDDARENTKLYYLGRSHKYKTLVRPWMFSSYIVCALETLMFWLGNDADDKVGRAWTNLCGYVLRRLLRAYLRDRTIPNEFYQNYDIEAVRKIMAQSQHSRAGMSQAQSQMMLSQMSQKEHQSQHSQGDAGSIKHKEIAPEDIVKDRKSVQISENIHVKHIDDGPAPEDPAKDVLGQ